MRLRALVVTMLCFHGWAAAAQVPIEGFDNMVEVSNHLAVFSRDPDAGISATSTEIMIYQVEAGQRKSIGSLQDFYKTLFSEDKILTSQRCVGLPENKVVCGLVPGAVGTESKNIAVIVYYQMKNGQITSAELAPSRKKP